MFKSILAVVLGYVVMVVLTMLMFLVWAAVSSQSLATTDTSPSIPALLGVLVGGLLCALAGGFVTASLAAKSPHKHALALAGLCVVMNVVTIATSPTQPLWYQIGLGLVAVAGVLLGARWKILRMPALSH